MPVSEPKKISQLNELEAADLNEEQDYVPVLQGSSGETKKLKAVAFTTTTIPVATNSVLGGIKVGGTLAISNQVLNLGTLSSAGTYGTSSAVPRITVDSYGRITTVSTQSLTLNGMTDISLTNLSNDQVLRYNAGAGRWENVSPTLVDTLDGLSDVTLNAPSSGQYLRYSGTAWVNSSLSASDIGTGTIPSAVLGNSSLFIGTTSVALNRASGSLTLNGVSIDGSAGTAAAVPWSGVSSKPTTLSGYGITDAAPLASPTFTGTPAAPTAAADTNTTQIATTAYVVGQGYLKSSTASSTYAPLASPSFTGTPQSAVHAFTTSANPPATPANGYVLYANSSNALSWKGANGYLRVFDGTSNTADRTYTLPDASGTIALTASPTFTGLITVSDAAAATIETLTDAATVAVDMSTGCNFTVTLGGNRALGNPTNATAGQSGSIFIVQDGTGSRTLSYGANWKFAGGSAPTLSTAASAVDRLDYIVRSSTNIQAVLTKAYA